MNMDARWSTRIYSSQDLKNSSGNPTYKDLRHGMSDTLSDCSQWWRTQVGSLSRGGRSYKVGDFKAQVDESKWAFVADDVYQDHDEIMNFSRIPMLPWLLCSRDFGTADR